MILGNWRLDGPRGSAAFRREREAARLVWCVVGRAGAGRSGVSARPRDWYGVLRAALERGGPAMCEALDEQYPLERCDRVPERPAPAGLFYNTRISRAGARRLMALSVFPKASTNVSKTERGPSPQSNLALVYVLAARHKKN